MCDIYLNWGDTSTRERATNENECGSSAEAEAEAGKQPFDDQPFLR